MATSESDDFESADEELDNRSAPSKRISSQRTRAVVDSESDDDNECTSAPVRNTYRNSRASNTKRRRDRDSASPIYPEDPRAPDSSKIDKNPGPEAEKPTDSFETPAASDSTAPEGLDSSNVVSSTTDNTASERTVQEPVNKSRRERPQRQQKSLGVKKLGATKLSSEKSKPATEITTKTEDPKENKSSEIEECWEELDDILSKPISGSASKWDSAWDNQDRPDDVAECWEGMDEDIEIPEELKSNKKFKEVFKSDGWEDIDETESSIQEDKTVVKEDILPVLDKLSLIGEEQDKSGGWGWGGWGVSSLINTASAGVNTLTNHVSHGLTMLEESIGVPDPEELANIEKTESDGKIMLGTVATKAMNEIFQCF